MEFIGVKIALFYKEQLVVIKRDDITGLRYAGLWDFPGGGRDNNETPFQCVRREVEEELGIELHEDNIKWKKIFPAMHDPKIVAWFMVGKISKQAIDSIKFGDEGSGWKFMKVEDFMNSNEVVEPLKGRLSAYLTAINNK